MSFTQYREFVCEGDTVVVFLGYQNLLTFTVDAKKVHQTKYGALPHKMLVGSRYGSKIHCARGYCYVLHPTPDLWTLTLPHRTQILYTTDISLILLQLDIKPGSIVVEAGTGSGSLSHSFMKSVYPNGHLYTFDFHEGRADTARQEFKDHDCASVVTVQHRDVCQDGFGLSNLADAVFLDLPLPWEALTFAKNALKQEGGRLCTFSPCIEQVQRTCERMRELAFVDIQVVECLVRTFEVREVAMPRATLTVTNGSSERGSKKQHAQVKATADGQQEEEAGGTECSVKTDDTDNKRTVSFFSAIPPRQMPGHTGFLVFATKPPSPAAVS